MVMCLARSHTQGTIFDALKFANSIPSFYETGQWLEKYWSYQNTGRILSL
jgi:hypothetical protein